MMNPPDKRTASNGNGVPAAVKDIVAAFSTQSNYSNRIWLVLIAAASIAIYPDSSGDTITLPLSLGRVPGVLSTQ